MVPPETSTDISVTIDHQTSMVDPLAPLRLIHLQQTAHTMTYPLITLNNIPVFELNGHETIGKLFGFNICLKLDASKHECFQLQDEAVICFNQSAKQQRSVSGIITKITKQWIAGAMHIHYRIEPRLRLLKQQSIPGSYANQSWREIILPKLLSIGYLRHQIKFVSNRLNIPKPITLQVPDESDFDFIHRLLGMAGVYYYIEKETLCFISDNESLPYLNPSQLVISNDADYAALFIDDTLPHLYELQSHKQLTTNQIMANSRYCLLAHGYVFNLNDDAYAVIGLEHKAKQEVSIDGLVNNCCYQNTVTLTSLHEPYPVKTPSHFKQPLLFSATIMPNNDDSLLDAQGHYPILFDFCCHKNVITAPLLSPYVANNKRTSQGFHFPLAEGNKVLVNFICNEPDKPVILGVIPTQPVITCDNKQTAVFMSKHGSGITFNQQAGKEELSFATANKTNQLSINSAKGHECIQLASELGDIVVRAADNINFTNSADSIMSVGKDCLNSVGDEFTLNTHSGSINIKTTLHQQYSSEKTLKLTATDIQLQAHHGFNSTSTDDLLFGIEGSATNININNGQLLMLSQNDINLTSRDSIIIQYKNTRLELSATGEVIISGKNIIFDAEQEVTIKGEVHMD